MEQQQGGKANLIARGAVAKGEYHTKKQVGYDFFKIWLLGNPLSLLREILGNVCFATTY